jgi:hypothetical protein|tara:strand:+ start:63 stop:380 length:318 start_codon:yes stop_codon:yes gene_type:complete
MNPVYLVDGKEWKFCNGCERDLPISAYYDYRPYGGNIVSRCRECTKKRNEIDYRERDLRDVKGIAKKLNRKTLAQRYGSFYAMRNKIDEPTFRKLIQVCFEGGDQ